MRNRVLASVAILAAMAGSAGLVLPEVWAQPGQPAQPGGRPGGPPGQPGRPGGPGGERQIQSVGGGMRLINRGLRQLEPSIGDPAAKEQNLQAVWLMQRGCLGAKAARPDDVEGDPAEVLDKFRHGQIRLMALLLELETAILDGKPDEARVILAKVKDHRDAAHKALGVKEEEPGPDGGR